MNLTDTIVPDSTQLNAEDFIATGPRTFTITSVSAGNAEQPVNIFTAEEPDRAYRPGKSMRRLLVAAWGPETDVYVGRRLTLYRDPDIRFGKEAVGGVRISHLSHIDRPLKIALTVKRGQRDPFTVQPLAESKPATKPTTDRLAVTLAAVEMASTVDQVRAVWDEHAELLDEADRNRLKDAMVAAKARIDGGAS